MQLTNLIQRCLALRSKQNAFELTDDAKPLLQLIISYFELDEHRNHPVLGAIYARGIEHVKRIASILSVETSTIDANSLLYAMKAFMFNIESCKSALSVDNKGKNGLLPLEERAREIVIKYLSSGPKNLGTLANNMLKCSNEIRDQKIECSNIEYVLLNKMIRDGVIVSQGSSKQYVLPDFKTE